MYKIIDNKKCLWYYIIEVCPRIVIRQAKISGFKREKRFILGKAFFSFF